MPEPKRPFRRVKRAFDRDMLKWICEMHEREFATAYDMSTVLTRSEGMWKVADYPLFYNFLDRGADILAVAHLDTCVDHTQRTASFVDTCDGPVVHSGALDDRLGAYTILELLPQLGVNVDVLLTTGEEDGMSTAEYFTPPPDKEYRWVIEFDRGGTDVVMYQYDDAETRDLVKACGARVGSGSFSDIAYLEHLEVKGFNWGVGYQDYHSVRGYAYLHDYWTMVALFLKFHAANAETYLPHDVEPPWTSRGSLSWLDDEDDWMRRWRGVGGEDCESWGEHRFGSDHVLDECPLYAGLEPDDLVSEDFSEVNQTLLAAGE